MRWLPLVLTLGGCAAPLAVHRQDLVLSEVAARYHAFYPAAGDPDPAHDAGLLRPRFGLPAIAQAGGTFPVELLERGFDGVTRAALLTPAVSDADAARCLDGAPVDGCFVVTLTASARTPLAGATVASFNARADAPPGAYDFFLHPPCDAPTRAPRAVWLRADDPAQLREVRVVHLSDIHVGKHVEDVEQHLKQVIVETNALQPDLVVITGDIVNQGLNPSLPPRARALLLALEAPTAIVLGNHDIGFRSFTGARYGAGWENFARAFHPFLEFELELGGYRFVGFDSGPSTLSPRILTRGLGAATLAHLRALIAGAANERGVVLFSHAPSRAVLSGNALHGGVFGHMRSGHAELERILLDAAARGQRVLHLAGHTHWSDVFEATPDGRDFVRWPDGAGSNGLTPIHARAALVTTQAATHAGPWPKPSARGWGFTYVVLGDGEARVAFHRHGDGAIAQRDSRR